MSFNLGVIGCGKMAYALLKGIHGSSEYRPDFIYVCDPDQDRVDLFSNDYKAVAMPAGDLVGKSQIVILAVKPGQVQEVLNNTAVFWNDQKLLISVAAGIKTVDLEKNLNNQPTRIVRVMPNTPSLVGEGMSAICAGSRTTDDDLNFVRALLNGSGKSIIIDEKYMDAVTAVSGSGPAYVFLLVEALMEAAVNAGLNSNIARQLVLQTFKGSITMLEDSGEHPAILKAQVCSPGGTTIAGVRQLEAGGVRSAIFNAVEAASIRSKELGEKKD
ncbi:Pyrroline-5-carboxylate reductase [Syntrophomonas zehnderi OL-4]|uniref:Pyrroline-5-carboxylate reductase n=1 Tax=Syntrophomonas zehnderi OL-4 TaxID=690567 RepID=A0A0E4C8M2_9FIRM|nr:pyrroline-5-carboxylate reductase [Syntrophomonas zehnderi]CFX57426.1 Pyrroline-5-carboxylate reductase [Syntrophomonas zehnderi OL-4]